MNDGDVLVILALTGHHTITVVTCFQKSLDNICSLVLLVIDFDVPYKRLLQ